MMSEMRKQRVRQALQRGWIIYCAVCTKEVPPPNTDGLSFCAECHHWTEPSIRVVSHTVTIINNTKEVMPD